MPVKSNMLIISSFSGTESSIFASIAGAMSSSAMVLPAPVTASPTTRIITGLCVAHAVFIIYAVFCHMLYFGFLVFSI